MLLLKGFQRKAFKKSTYYFNMGLEKQLSTRKKDKVCAYSITNTSREFVVLSMKSSRISKIKKIKTHTITKIIEKNFLLETAEVHVKQTRTLLRQVKP